MVHCTGGPSLTQKSLTQSPTSAISGQYINYPLLRTKLLIFFIKVWTTYWHFETISQKLMEIELFFDLGSYERQIKDHIKIQTKSTGEKFADFAKKNVYLAGGFTGGFFIGLASS